MMFGREIAFPRRCKAYGQDYSFTGQVANAAPLAQSHALVQEVVSAANSVDELSQHNGLLLNYYDAAKGEYIGPHSDDEGDLVWGAPILSLSWCTRGHYRRFRLTTKPGVKDAPLPSWGGLKPGIMHVKNGDLIVMGGECQRTHKHEIMKSTKALPESSGRRINLTLRAFKQQTRKRAREQVAEADEHGGPVPRPA